MAFDLGTFLGGNIGEAVGKIVGLFKVDPTVALTKQTELAEIQLQLQGKLQDAISAEIQAQTAVNLQEAKSDKIFIAGWRPWIGWTCGMIFAVNFIVGPIVNWVFVLRHIPGAFPKMDLSEAMPVLLGMLGLGTMRSYEKVQGAQNQSVGH